MSTNYSSPTANLFDLLKPEEDKKAKPTTKQPVQKSKRLTPEEKAREEAEKIRQANEAKKMEAALVNQHEEEARAEGFFLNAPTTSGKAAPKTGHLSRAEWEAKKANGELSVEVQAVEAPQQQQQQQPRNYNNNNNNNNNNNFNNQRGNRNFDSPSGEVKEQRNRGDRNFDRQGGDNQERRGPKPGREFDRHSQAQTGRKYNEKRGGGGKFNIGNEAEAPVEVAEVEAVVEKTDAAVATEPATTDASAVVTAVVDAKPLVADPDDEGFGKFTLSQYETQRAAEAEALAKLVPTIAKRTDVDKKIDLSKCFEADKHDDKYSKHAKNHAKATGTEAAKPKSKTIEFNEFLKQEGIVNPQANQQRGPRPNPGNRKLPGGRNQFPSLGEEPQPRQQNSYNNRSEQSENREYNGNNQSNNNSNYAPKSNYQGQRQQGQGGDRPNRPPRQQGQGVQQGQGSQQPQQGQRQQGQQGQGQRQGQGQGQRQQGQDQGQFRGNNQGNNQGQRSQGTA